MNTSGVLVLELRRLERVEQCSEFNDDKQVKEITPANGWHEPVTKLILGDFEPIHKRPVLDN